MDGVSDTGVECHSWFGCLFLVFQKSNQYSSFRVFLQCSNKALNGYLELQFNSMRPNDWYNLPMRSSRIVLFVAALVLVGCTASSEAVRVGFIGPLTGDAVSYGNDTLHATEMAVNEWNAKGGIDGTKIKLIVEDGRCNASDAASAARKLIDVDHVSVILGGNCSSETLAAAPIAEEAQVILLATASSSKDVTNAGDYVFRMWPSNAKAARIVYSKYFQNNTVHKLAIVSEQTDYCKSLHDSVMSTLPQGIEVVFDEQAEAGTKDFRTLFTRLQNIDFDVIIVNMQGDATIAAAISQLRDAGIRQQILTNEIGESNTLSQIAGEAVDGTQLISAAFPDENREPGSSFVKKFVDQYGQPKQSIVFPALAYDAANILFTAIQNAGYNGTLIRDYLYNLQQYAGTVGYVSFDQNGDVEGIPYSVKQWKNGSIKELDVIPLE